MSSPRCASRWRKKSTIFAMNSMGEIRISG
jgi:hypothetical protein